MYKLVCFEIALSTAYSLNLKVYNSLLNRGMDLVINNEIPYKIV